MHCMASHPASETLLLALLWKKRAIVDERSPVVEKSLVSDEKSPVLDAKSPVLDAKSRVFYETSVIVEKRSPVDEKSLISDEKSLITYMYMYEYIAAMQDAVLCSNRGLLCM